MKQQQENEDFHRAKVEEHRKIIFNREMDFLNKKHDLIKGKMIIFGLEFLSFSLRKLKSVDQWFSTWTSMLSIERFCFRSPRETFGCQSCESLLTP